VRANSSNSAQPTFLFHALEKIYRRIGEETPELSSYVTGDYEMSVSAALAQEQAQILLETAGRTAYRKNACKHHFLARNKYFQKISQTSPKPQVSECRWKQYRIRQWRILGCFMHTMKINIMLKISSRNSIHQLEGSRRWAPLVIVWTEPPRKLRIKLSKK
jgi:hypothetical protein